jgi:hypothetical protein
MTIVTDDSNASHAGGPAEDAVERALAAVIRDPARIGDLLDELSRGRLWMPLPDDEPPVTDGSDVHLPTVRYLGIDLVPAFTSGARLRASVPRPRDPAETGPPPEAFAPPRLKPHIVVPAAAVARLLPADVGLALNPGAGDSLPVYPQGVAYLASAADVGSRSRITVGPPPDGPEVLFGGIRTGLAAVPTASQAAAAWLAVELAGEGLVISVTLDDPKNAQARDAVLGVVERVAQATPCDPWFPIDVTFPGEGRTDPVDEWISARGVPFYRRDPA